MVHLGHHNKSTFDVALLGLFSPESYDMEILAVIANVIKPGGTIVLRSLQQGMIGLVCLGKLLIFCV